MTTTSRALLLWFACGSTAFAAGGIIVDSSEAGAGVFIDGADSGMETPATIMGLSPGQHTVTVRSGCYQGETRVVVTDDKVIPVTVELTAGDGTLTVQPVPVDAVIELDGKVMKGAPGRAWDVSCGPHGIRASLDGYLDTFVTVEVGAGAEVVLPIQLEALGVGTLLVTTSPPGSTLFLDDKKVGTSPAELGTVVAGPHVIEARLAGHANANKQFVLESGERLELDLSLSPDASVAAASTIPKEPKPAKVKSDRSGPSGKRIAGYGLIAAGVGSGAVALGSWSQGRSAYSEYLDRAAAVNAGEQPASYASDYYDREVKKFKGPVYGTTAAAVALIGSGVGLAFVF